MLALNEKVDEVLGDLGEADDDLVLLVRELLAILTALLKAVRQNRFLRWILRRLFAIQGLLLALEKAIGAMELAIQAKLALEQARPFLEAASCSHEQPNQPD